MTHVTQTHNQSENDTLWPLTSLMCVSRDDRPDDENVSECLLLLGSSALNMTNEHLAGDHPTTASLLNFLPEQPLA